jgi:hypothetical protein
MTGARIAVPLGLAVALAVAALTILPRAFEAESLIAAQDDPAALADRAVARSFDAEVADREIRAALAANDADLANSFLELARDQNVQVDPALATKVQAAVAAANSASGNIESFARGLITGEPDDLVGLAGTTLGDLFVFGDIRDAVREGTRFATGQPVDEMILGLAVVGLAVTAGTYATVGVATPARVGLSLVKAARKTGRMSAQLAAWIGRSVRETVDWAVLRRALAGATVSNPAIAVRAAREAVKVEKAQGLMRLVGDVGRVQSKAGTKAALDGLKLAERPRDMAKVAELAAKKGGKTRAILKVAGRGAIMLTVGTFNLAMWMFWALLTVFGFVSSLKKMSERATERYCARRRLRIAREREACARAEREAAAHDTALAARAASSEEPAVIYSSSPALVPQSLGPAPQLPAPTPRVPVAQSEEAERAAIQRPRWPGLPPHESRERSRTPEAIESTVVAFRGAPKVRSGNA